eukprot:SAG22_NODE_1776_length_3607_cov_2.601482_2_plen_431_part_00
MHPLSEDSWFASLDHKGYSGWTAWGLLFAAYPVTLCQDKGLLYSTQPWAGSYNIQGSVWTTAHFTQFSEPGWSWLAENNGTGSFGTTGRFATLVDPSTGDWSTIVNNLDSTDGTQLAFAVRGSRHAGAQELSLFATNETAWFVQLPPPKLDAEGRFELDVQPETVYTLTTLAGAKAARKGDHPHFELAAPFPLPHADNFSGYTDGRSPRFFTDWDGSFSIVGDVLKQQVLHPPIRWHCTDVDPITLVGAGYSNYDVSTTARIDSSAANASAAATYVSVCARQQKPFSGWCPSASGYCLKLANGGAWSLAAGKTVIAHGTATAADGSPLNASPGVGQAGVKVIAGQQYYLVSEELGAKSQDDGFYTTTKNYPCIGAPGPGGTLPKLDVQVDSVRIDGGVYCLTNGTASQPWQPVLWDYRPRSYGPLSFAVA